MQEKRRHQQVSRVLRHIVAEELRTQPALGQATHGTKTWVLLLKSRNKRGKKRTAAVRNRKWDVTLVVNLPVKSEKQDAVVIAGSQHPHTAVQGQGGSHRQAVSNTRTGLVAEKGKKLLTSNNEFLAVRVPSTLPPKITTLGGISHHKAIWEVGDSDL